MSIDVPKNSKRGRPPVDSEKVCARIAQPLLGRLDTWREAQEDKPERPEAVRRLIDKGLQS